MMSTLPPPPPPPPLLNPPDNTQAFQESFSKALNGYHQSEISKNNLLYKQERHIFLHDVPLTVTTAEIEKLLTRIGPTLNCSIVPNDPLIQPQVVAKPLTKTYLIEFADHLDAKNALRFASPMIGTTSVRFSLATNQEQRNTYFQHTKTALQKEMRSVTFTNFPFTITPSDQLVYFLKSFGEPEEYTIIPYSTTQSLIYVQYPSFLNVSTICNLFAQLVDSNSTTSQSTSQSPPLFIFGNQIQVYPGFWKPPVLYTKFDIYPFVKCNWIRGSTAITLSMDTSFHDEFDLVQNNLHHAFLPSTLQRSIALEEQLHLAIAGNPNNYDCLLITNAYPSSSSPTPSTQSLSPQEANDILQDVLQEAFKYGRILASSIHSNGQIYLQYSHSQFAGIAAVLFKSLVFDGNNLTATLLSQDAFKRQNPSL